MKYLRLSIAILAALSAIIIFQGCHTTRQVTTGELAGEWVLKTINGKEARNEFPTQLPTFQIDFQSKMISGTGGCNRYSGRFILINNTLNSPNIASTRMFCMEPNAEDEFFAALREDKNLTIENGILQMRRGNKVVLEFKKNTPVNAEAINGAWHLYKIEGEEATNVFTGEGARIPNFTFNMNDRKVSGMAGCNRFNSNAVLQGSTINISPAVTTRMACPNLQAENRFLELFRGDLQISMPDHNTLLLRIQDNDMLEFKRGSTI